MPPSRRQTLSYAALAAAPAASIRTVPFGPHLVSRLSFKVYGASRNCQSPGTMLAALNLAFKSAKPNDAIVVGMFPKNKEQAAEDCRLCLEAMRSAT